MQEDPPVKIDSKEYTLLGPSPANEDEKPDNAPSLLVFSLIHLTTLCLFFHEAQICISVLAFLAFTQTLAYIHSSCQSTCSIEDVAPGVDLFKAGLFFCTPRIVAVVWLIVSWQNVDEQRELMASFLVISIRRLHWSETFIALILRTLLFLLHGRADQLEDKDLVPIPFGDQQSFRVLLSLPVWAPFLAFLSGYFSSIASSAGGGLDQANSEIDNEDPGEDIEDGIRSITSSPSNKGLKGASRFHAAVECIPNWSPPSHKQVKAWREAFSLNEELLRYYKCTLLHEKSSYQGTLFLSIGHVSFRGSRGVFLSKYLQFTMAHQSIKEVKSEGSNMSTLCLTRPHLLKGEQVSSIELRNCQGGCQEVDAVLKGLRGNRRQLRKALGQPTYESIQSVPVAPFGPQLKFSDGDPFRNVLDITVTGLDLESFADELMQDEWIPEMYMLHLFERQGATEIVVMPWCLAPPELSDASRPAGKVRDLALVMPVPPAPMCPKSTKMTFTYHVVFSPALEEGVPPTILIESSAQSHDVPFGNSFLVQERTEFSPCDSGASVKKEARVLFTRSVGFLKSKIQGSVHEGLIKSATEMGDFLQSWNRHKHTQ